MGAFDTEVDTQSSWKMRQLPESGASLETVFWGIFRTRNRANDDVFAGASPLAVARTLFGISSLQKPARIRHVRDRFSIRSSRPTIRVHSTQQRILVAASLHRLGKVETVL